MDLEDNLISKNKQITKLQESLKASTNGQQSMHEEMETLQKLCSRRKLELQEIQEENDKLRQKMRLSQNEKDNFQAEQVLNDEDYHVRNLKF